MSSVEINFELFWGVNIYLVGWKFKQRMKKTCFFLQFSQLRVVICHSYFDRFCLTLFLSFMSICFNFLCHFFSFPAFLLYKGRILWVAAHYNTISSTPHLMRQKQEGMCVCVCVHGYAFVCGIVLHKGYICIYSSVLISAFMVCFLLFVSIFIFAYAIRYLSYAQAFQVSSRSPLLIHTFTQSLLICSSWPPPIKWKLPNHLCASAVAGEEDKSWEHERKEVCPIQKLKVSECVFCNYSLDKWKTKELWHSCSSLAMQKEK